MITGEMLYHEEKALVLLDKVRKAEIPNLRERRAGLPPELEAIALRALSRDRERRFQTAAEMQGALTGFLYKNWPAFNRTRLAEFVRQAFGEQRFVLPMPSTAPIPEVDTVPRKRITPAPVASEPTPAVGPRRDPREAAPAPKAPPAPKPPPPRPPAPAASTDQLLMRADDFVAQEHSVIFDLRSKERVGQRPAPPERDDDDGDRTVAGAWYPGVDRALAQEPEEEEEATIAQMVWGPGQGGDDEDTTAVLDLDPAEVVRRAEAQARGGVNDATAQLDPPPTPTPAAPPRSALAGPSIRPPQPPPGAPRREPREAPKRPAPEPPPTRALTPPRDLGDAPTPQARPPAAPSRPAPPPPEPPAPVPTPAPAAEAPKAVPRPKPNNRSPEAARPTLNVQSMGALKKPSTFKRLGRWLATPAGITVLVLVALAGYAAATFLPTLLADEAPMTATLVLDSVPRGAKVTLDGKATAQETPATLSGLSTGANHTVVLELSGFEQHTEVVNVSAEEASGAGEVRRRIFLKKALGTLHVRSEPVGAEVYLDGKYVGDTPITRRNMDRDKERFLLLLRKDGFREQREIVEWKEKTELTLDFPLQKRGN
jgi:hypothetical protein